ncbi:MAG: stage II sporulation protein M [Burkholderiaceae bacterium]|jgi:uncharacterized membrane protein SpoIIM required for sporulation|nr:stage II sporulation protein M [Burkholderiaceae bacterium]
MTPMQFEARHQAQWLELESLLTKAESHAAKGARADGARLALLYRRACEQLALAQARAYPVYLTQRIERLAARAHRQVYRPPAWNAGRIGRFFLTGFPQAVREHRGYVLAAALLFVLPLMLMGWACWRDPGFILHVADADQVRQYDAMYRDDNGALGPMRDAGSDWMMFGLYVMNNIGIGFQCFASGLFAGLGSVFYLVFNGVFIGAVGGYLVGAGKAENFFSFVVTHSSFELTAIVLSGAAGLRLGHALLAPGRRTRLQALKFNASQAIVLVYGVIGMLLVAAAIEAFWSSARWITPGVKYGVGAACWVLVLIYLGWQGRPLSAASLEAPPGSTYAG